MRATEPFNDSLLAMTDRKTLAFLCSSEEGGGGGIVCEGDCDRGNFWGDIFASCPFFSDPSLPPPPPLWCVTERDTNGFAQFPLPHKKERGRKKSFFSVLSWHAVPLKSRRILRSPLFLPSALCRRFLKVRLKSLKSTLKLNVNQKLIGRHFLSLINGEYYRIL